MDINPEEFHKSITHEIKSLQNRVRHLIGDANWGDEGRYKEAVLKNVIKKFLPSNISLGTGFVVDKNDGHVTISKQIDIIIYDNTYPVLFSEGDVLVTTPANVRGIIEVKTQIKNSELQGIISIATDNGRLIGEGIFNGIFAFNRMDTAVSQTHLSTALKNSDGAVNHICLGQDIFIKYWSSLFSVGDESSREYSVYKIHDFSFTYFISNLLDYLSKDQLKERWWF
ncbi:DUF6602 domain-containing protein, partial [Chloroflexota bacterium]